MADFAQKLAFHMTAVGASQNGLAKLSGVPQSTISAYLSRTNKPSWEHVQKLARAIGIGCAELQDDPDKTGDLDDSEIEAGNGDAAPPTPTKNSKRKK